MIILGIHHGHDSCAALIRDGELEYGVNPQHFSAITGLAVSVPGRNCRFDDCMNNWHLTLMSLKDLESLLQEPCMHHAVKRLQVFGSVSRGQETLGSDVDFLVQFLEMPPGEYARKYFDFLHRLEDVLGRPVDLLTSASLKRESLKRSIQNDAIVLYEA